MRLCAGANAEDLAVTDGGHGSFWKSVTRSHKNIRRLRDYTEANEIRNPKFAIRNFLSRQLAILDSMRRLSLRTQTRLAIFFIVRIVSFEPDDLAVALEREHMRRDAIQKPATYFQLLEIR